MGIFPFITRGKVSARGNFESIKLASFLHSWLGKMVQEHHHSISIGACRDFECLWTAFLKKLLFVCKIYKTLPFILIGMASFLHKLVGKDIFSQRIFQLMLFASDALLFLSLEVSSLIIFQVIFWFHAGPYWDWMMMLLNSL